ncbi:MAG: 50S ribosomal protein L25/general stress protein Ctc [Cytophagales bacterium]|nr:MAG: 50S ribosomal protein L25/general stress protein Ctc [Cytophagales bacterium]
MKTIEIKGFKRANLGKTESTKLRTEAKVPAVIYGGKEAVHVAIDMFSFRDFVYTPDVFKIAINIEGKKYTTILKEIQFHPVSDMILHADFLELSEDKIVTLDIPVKFVGSSPGIMKGGKLAQKIGKLSVKGLPKDLPSFVEVDISNLDLNKSVKVSEVSAPNVVILTNKSNPIATITVPRGLKDAAAPAADAKPAKKK